MCDRVRVTYEASNQIIFSTLHNFVLKCLFRKCNFYKDLRKFHIIKYSENRTAVSEQFARILRLANVSLHLRWVLAFDINSNLMQFVQENFFLTFIIENQIQGLFFPKYKNFLRLVENVFFYSPRRSKLGSLLLR